MQIPTWTAWAIRPDYIEQLIAAGRPQAGDGRTDGDKDPRQQLREQGYSITEGGIAVVPIVGVLARGGWYFPHRMGWTSYAYMTEAIGKAAADEAVRAIVLDIDSPGGTVAGIATFTSAILDAKRQKPVVAYTDGAMASGAYWAGSAAAAIVAERTATVGSIGVLYVHHDWSKYDEKMGVKPTVIAAGKYKAVGNDAGPLSDEDRSVIQAELDALYEVFVDTVAGHRGVAPETVRSQMADGRIFIGEEARRAGLVDTIGTLSDALALAGQMAGQTGQSRPTFTNVIGAAAPNMEETDMDKKQIIESLTTEELVAGNPTVAETLRRQGADGVDPAAAVKSATGALLALAEAHFGAEAAAKFSQIVATGVTVDQYKAIVGDSAPGLPPAKDTTVQDKEQILAALKNSGAANPGPDNGSEAGGKDFNALVAEYKQLHKCSLFDAQAAVMKAHPQAHAAYLKSVNATVH